MVEIKQTKEVEKILRCGFGYKDKDKIDYGESDESEFEQEHKRHQQLVKEILEGWTPTTNSDVLLYFEYLRTRFDDVRATSSKDEVIFHFPKRLIKYFPSPESVTRARRSLNQKGIGLPTNPAVIEKRKIREKAIRKYFGGLK